MSNKSKRNRCDLRQPAKKVAALQCYRCKDIGIDRGDWNTQHIAGHLVGNLCPTCQTAEENAEAEMNDAIGNPQIRNANRRQLQNGDELQRYIYSLINLYPTPQIMRTKAAQLASGRPDLLEGPVLLMRAIADDMESGALYE